MKISKSDYKKGKRLTIAFLLCLPIFLLVSYLLQGAQSFLIILINLCIAGVIMFTTAVLGEKKDIKNAELHEKHLQEIEERKNKSKNNHSLNIIEINENDITEQSSTNDINNK